MTHFWLSEKRSNFTLMKKANKTDKKLTIIKVDKKLDKYLGKGLFQEKVDKANHILKTVGIPKFAK